MGWILVKLARLLIIARLDILLLDMRGMSSLFWELLVRSLVVLMVELGVLLLH